jgi:hypothetical protein
MKKAAKANAVLEFDADLLARKWKQSGQNCIQYLLNAKKEGTAIHAVFGSVTNQLERHQRLQTGQKNLQIEIAKNAAVFSKLAKQKSLEDVHYSSRLNGLTNTQAIRVREIVDLYQQKLAVQNKIGATDKEIVDAAIKYESAMLNVDKVDKQILEQAVKHGVAQADIGDSIQKNAAKSQKLASASSKISSLFEDSKWSLGGMLSELVNIAPEFAVILESAKSVAKFVGQMFTDFFALNKQLQQANSAMYTRLALTKANYFATIATGASQEEIGAAQAALLDIGLKNKATSVSTLETMSMMERSLGVSVQDSAKLALYSQVLGANFTRVGDSVAYMVDNFNLTATEATHLTQSMGEFERILGNDVSGDKLAHLAAGVGALAGSMKSFGVSAGTITALVDHMGSLEGIGDAAIFGGSGGILDPKSLSTAQGVADMVETVGNRLNQMTGGSPVMLAALGPMLQRMGLTMEQARGLMQQAKNPTALAEMKRQLAESQKAQKITGALNERYTNQMLATGQVLSMLKNALVTIGKVALWPVFEVVSLLLPPLQWLASGVTEIVGTISDLVDWVNTSNSMLAEFVLAVSRTVKYGFIALRVACQVAVVGLMALGVAMLAATGPIGWTVAAVIAAVVAFKLLIKPIRWAITEVHSLVDAFASKFPRVFSALKMTVEAVLFVVNPIAKFFMLAKLGGQVLGILSVKMQAWWDTIMGIFGWLFGHGAKKEQSVPVKGHSAKKEQSVPVKGHSAKKEQSVPVKGQQSVPVKGQQRSRYYDHENAIALRSSSAPTEVRSYQTTVIRGQGQVSNAAISSSSANQHLKALEAIRLETAKVHTQVKSTGESQVKSHQQLSSREIAANKVRAEQDIAMSGTMIVGR